MTQFIIITALTALLAAWVVTLGYKWGVIEWMQANAPTELLHKLFSCDFCISWWCNVVLSIFVSCYLHDWAYMLIPFFATKITQRML